MLKTYIAAKTQIENFKVRLEELSHDENGAALIEYSILIGLISAVAVGAVIAVGGWVTGQWGALQTALAGAGA